MKQHFISFLLMIGGLFMVNAQERNFLETPYVQVNGVAEMEIVPDEIYIAISINEIDNKGKESVEQLEKSMLKALTELGIDVKNNLSLKDLSSNFKKNMVRNPQIRTQKEYQLMVNNSVLAARVLIALETLGISNMSIDRVNHSQIEQYRREARINAVKDARQKAADLAQAVDQTIGKAVYIEGNFFNDESPIRYKMATVMLEDNAAGSLPEIEFEKIKITARVSACFLLF